MKEKSEQEQRAAERQVELISDALNSAKDNAGFWMNQGRIMPPRLYPKGPTVSPFNASLISSTCLSAARCSCSLFSFMILSFYYLMAMFLSLSSDCLSLVR